ncbi:hypothetical protein VEE40_45740 (plasmid) [Escherichia coli]|nr:hypothetical protein VEE40_45740 [Escherichia coli]
MLEQKMQYKIYSYSSYPDSKHSRIGLLILHIVMHYMGVYNNIYYVDNDHIIMNI